MSIDQTSPLDAIAQLLSRSRATPKEQATLADVEDAVGDIGAIFGEALSEVRATTTVLSERIAALEVAATRSEPPAKPRVRVPARSLRQPNPDSTAPAEHAEPRGRGARGAFRRACSGGAAQHPRHGDRPVTDSSDGGDDFKTSFGTPCAARSRPQSRRPSNRCTPGSMQLKSGSAQSMAPSPRLRPSAPGRLADNAQAPTTRC